LNKEDLSGRGLELILNVLTGVHIEQQARSILKSVLFDNDAVDEMLQPTEASDSPVLHTLVSRNAPNALGVFLDLEPDLATLDLQGNTALHIAARLDRVAYAKLLLNSKIDVNVENNSGKTALQIALQLGYKEVSNDIFMALPMSLVDEDES
jgi:ankyrin repeat protein